VASSTRACEGPLLPKGASLSLSWHKAISKINALQADVESLRRLILHHNALCERSGAYEAKIDVDELPHWNER